MVTRVPFVQSPARHATERLAVAVSVERTSAASAHSSVAAAFVSSLCVPWCLACAFGICPHASVACAVRGHLPWRSLWCCHGVQCACGRQKRLSLLWALNSAWGLLYLTGHAQKRFLMCFLVFYASIIACVSSCGSLVGRPRRRSRLRLSTSIPHALRPRGVIFGSGFQHSWGGHQ